MRRSDLKRYFSDSVPALTSLVLAGIIGGGLLNAACSRESSTASMTTPTTPPTTTSPSGSNAATNERDVHSFAIPQEARVTHVTLDLRADFAAKRLSGTATLDLERVPNANKIVLDTQELDIHGVTDGSGKAVPFALGTNDKILGRPLTVTLSPDTRRIVVNYTTSPDAAALQWLDPEQTAGKRHPYLFSQGEATLTRTWIPTQDSPGIRQTYDAHIMVPDGLRAVMSAEQLTPDGTVVSGGRRFDFRLTHPIPPYLIAIAIGDLAFRSMGRRTGVYTEPAVLESAAWTMATWLAMAVETWIALWALGLTATYAHAYILESVAQGVRSVFFLVPGALGFQEGGYVVVGKLLGIGAADALALSLIHRAREIVWGIPGLLAWQWLEGKRLWTPRAVVAPREVMAGAGRKEP